MVIGLNAKAWHTFKIRELSMDWRTPVPPIHTKCTMPLGLRWPAAISGNGGALF